MSDIDEFGDEPAGCLVTGTTGAVLTVLAVVAGLALVVCCCLVGWIGGWWW